jgi:hypothetical protein
MDSSRIHRLAHTLIDRQSAVFDTQTKQTYRFFDRGKLLEKYKDRSDVFASFTDLPKLGINPQSEYDTPIGVYAYPIGYTYRKFTDTSGKFGVPFAADSSYIHIFQFSNINNCLVFDADDSVLVEEITNSFPDGSVIDKEMEPYHEVIDDIQRYVDDTLR